MYQPPTGELPERGKPLVSAFPRTEPPVPRLPGAHGRLGMWAAGRSHTPRKREGKRKERPKEKQGGGERPDKERTLGMHKASQGKEGCNDRGR